MNSIVRLAIAVGMVAMFVLSLTAQTQPDGVVAQETKPVHIYRFYTGPDNLSHVEKIEPTFTQNPGGIYKLMTVTGAEIHRGKAGRASDWHPAAGGRPHYVIDLAGHKEIEVAGGVKVELGAGDIELIEDTHGKGHITRNVGTEDDVSVWLPIADQSAQ